jgi:hypothetical protein
MARNDARITLFIREAGGIFNREAGWLGGIRGAVSGPERHETIVLRHPFE